MDENLIEKYKILLKGFQQLPYAEECLGILNEDELIIHRDTLVDKDVLAETYYHREKVQEEVNKNIAVHGIDFLLKKLKLSTTAKVRVINLIGQKLAYVIHVEDDKDIILAILKNESMNLHRKYEQISAYKKHPMPLSLNLSIYKSGKLFENIEKNE